VLAVYALKGDSLTFCHNARGPRPTTLNPVKRSPQERMTFKRLKKR
jgi:hypothetical protein